jgi:hypothetical protein
MHAQAPGKWLYWAWLCACSAWLARKAAQRKAAAALSLRAALRSGAQQFDLLHCPCRTCTAGGAALCGPVSGSTLQWLHAASCVRDEACRNEK